MSPRTDAIVRFDAIDCEDLPLAGGKGANLGELVEARFSVPSGFIVTTDAYRALIDAPAIREAIDDLEALDPAEAEELAATAASIRSLVRSWTFEEGIAASIADTLDTDSDTPYAVRSSATAEDLPTASFAGQHETSSVFRERT
jgi:pyruvate,water dikinase